MSVRITKSAVAESAVRAIFVQPEITTQWISIEDVENAKANMLMSKGIADMMETKADKFHEYAFRQFIEQPSDRLVSTLNRMHANQELLQVMIGKLSLKIQVRRNPEFSEFDNARVAPTVAFMIINSLIETRVIQTLVKTLADINEMTGKKTWRKQTVVTFGYNIPENDMYIKGVHLEPTVTQKKTKVRAGGKSTKLGALEKRFLKEASATPLRIIDIDPAMVRQYMETSAWYQSVLKGDDERGMDIITAEDLVERQVAKFILLQSLGEFFLDLWLDYRTRLYYTMTEMGFNLHGKTFETSLFELAKPKYITNKGLDALAYSAAVIVDGERMPHHTAIERFTANKEYYITELKATKEMLKDGEGNLLLDARTGEPMEDLGKSVYNTRLAKAIEDHYASVPSHFLLGEDATNGGLQHGGVGFKEPKMMIPGNVGGADHVIDSHWDLCTLVGYDKKYDTKSAARKASKDNISQGLFHGQSFVTIAKNMGVPLASAKYTLRQAYGDAIFNIEAIADWGTAVIDNNNTSLQWTTSDGFKAQSIAYNESVELVIYSPSTATKDGRTQVKITRDMPMILDAKGRSINPNAKVRGLYANITHSVDGTGLRYVIRYIKAANNDVEAGGVYKHDNFLVHPNDMEHARAGYKVALVKEFNGSPYQSALDAIVANHKGKHVPVAPTLVIGDATEDMIINSHYYLAP